MKSTNVVLRSIAALTVTSVLAVGSALAGSASWNGTTDSTWANTDNWSASPVPGSGDTATFSGAGNGNTTLDLGVGITLGSLLFDTAGAAAYTIGTTGSQSLTLDDSGAVQRSGTVTSDERVNASITLGTATAASYLLSNSTAAGRLTFAGAVAGGAGGAAGDKVLTIDGAGPTDISGAIANGGASSLALTKAGIGTLTLTGANSYSGPTVINAGNLKLRLTASVSYKLPSSGTAVANSGSAEATYNGTVVNGSLGSGNGPGGANAMTIYGGGYLQVGQAVLYNVAGYPITSGNFTASAWAFNIYGSDWATLFRGGRGDHQLLIHGTKLGAYASAGAGFMDSGYDVSGLIGRPEWHMLTVVGNGGANTMTFYVDGQVVGTVTGFASKTDIGSIGACFYQQTFSEGIANACIYDSSLSAAQVQQLYNDDLAAISYKLPASGTVVANNGTAAAAYNGTVIDGSIEAGAGPGGANALAITKNSGYLQVGPAVFNAVPGYPIASGDFTASAWAYHIYADNYATLFRGTYGHHQLLIQGTQLGAWSGGFQDSGYDISGLRERAEWHMLTVVGSSGADTMTYYVDGQAVGTVTGFDSKTEIGSIGANFFQQTFCQKIASACIHNRSFSAAQVLQLYNSDLANLPPAPVLPTATRVQIAAGATLDLGGTSQRVGSLADSGSTAGRVTTSGGPATLTIGGDTSTSFSGTLQGVLTLIKEGTGTQTLGGANSYGGATVVNGGTLKLDLPPAAPSGVAIGYSLPASGTAVPNSGSAGAVFNGTVVGGSIEAGIGPGGANAMTITKYVGYLQVGPAAFNGDPGYPITSGKFTASAWAYYIYADDYATLFRAGTGQHQLLIYGAQLGAWTGGGFVGCGYDISGLREKPEWHMLTVVGDSSASTMTYYVDGQAVGTVSGFDSYSDIGSLGANFGVQPFCQKIASACIYDSSLNAGQVWQLYLASRAGNPTGVLPAVTSVQIASGATLDLGGSSQQVGSLADSGGTGGAVTNSGAQVTLTIGGDNSSTSFTGSLQGALSLTKVGTGTQTLSGNNAFAGDVLVQGGTLAVSGGADVIPDTAAVEVRAGATLSVSGPEVIGALRVDLLGAGTVTRLTPKPNGALYLVNTSGAPLSWTIPLAVTSVGNASALGTWIIYADGVELKGYALGYDASAGRLRLFKKGTLIAIL